MLCCVCWWDPAWTPGFSGAAVIGCAVCTPAFHGDSLALRLEPPGQPGPLCRQEGASQTCPGWSHPARGCDSSTHGPFRKPRAASSGGHMMGSESLLHSPAPPMPIAQSSSHQRTCCAHAGWGEVVELWHRTLMGPPFTEPQQRTAVCPVSPPSLWDVEHQKCHFPI